MNYVPGTASLIDDIDSKLERRVEAEALWRRNIVSKCGIVV